VVDASGIPEAVAAHPPRLWVLHGGRIVADDTVSGRPHAG
jgi:hypothetical protein